jgi:hypothetical protein
LEQQEAASRSRASRAEAVARTRRRRHDGTVNRMAQFKLDCIPAELLDPAYVYRWIKDTPGRLRMATKMDDYDKVLGSELGAGFSMENTDSEGGETIRMYAGSEDGGPVYSYLCKKPRDFWIEDNEEVVRKREDMMAGRVYRAEPTDPDGHDLGEDDGAYVPAGVQMGGSAKRNRGPSPKNF